MVEALEPVRHVLGDKVTPELGAETGNEIDAAHGRSRLAQRGDRADKFLRRFPVARVKLEVGVRRCAKGEDSALRRAHPAIMNGRP